MINFAHSRRELTPSPRKGGVARGWPEHRVKEILLRFGRRLGLFALARLVTRRQLRILCYHGFATSDLVEFRPKMFMRPDTFERRLQVIRRLGMTPLGLAEAVGRLQRGTLPRLPVVITIDDGLTGVLRHAHPRLRAQAMPY